MHKDDKNTEKTPKEKEYEKLLDEKLKELGEKISIALDRYYLLGKKWK